MSRLEDDQQANQAKFFTRDQDIQISSNFTSVIQESVQTKKVSKTKKSKRLCETGDNKIMRSKRLCDIMSGTVGGGGHKVGTVRGYCNQRQALVIVVNKYASLTHKY